PQPSPPSLPDALPISYIVVGPRTVIHGGAVIGADGFGMAEEAGRWIKIMQIGRVVIGADVEIGANTTIDRGAIDDTVIEDDAARSEEHTSELQSQSNL